MTWTYFPIFLAAVAVAGSTGVIFQPGSWYEGLQKPGFTPPNIAFPIAWTILYVLMALAATRIASLGDAAVLGLALWCLQLVLNTLWTPVFFGAHRIEAGLTVILILWVAILFTTIAFLAADRLAGLMMLPYLAWVSYATALNWAIWRLNPAA